MSPEKQREEVQRVLHSVQFRRAPKLQRFLSLICEYHFTNRSQDISEFLIATEAFGKGATFDPSQDSLVRVQAREARRRLREYYQDEGKHSRLILDIPIGSYAPVFTQAHGAPQPRRLNSPRIAWVMLSVTALVCAALLFSADRQRRIWVAAAVSSAPPQAAATHTPTPLVSRLWDRFLNSDISTVLVVSNPDVGECVDTQATVVKISSAPVAATTAKETPCPDEYTGMGEAVAINLISNLFEAHKKTLIVKQSRMVNEDDVKRYNLVLLGGKLVNNWTLRLGGDLTLIPGARDIAPGLGPRYQTAFDPKTGQLIGDRGLIALRRHQSRGHWLLFLYGKHTQGTRGAVEGAMDERFLAGLQWPSASGPVPDSFRILVGMTVTDGIPEGPVPVALRVP
jgi:hypothetical protein